MKFIKIFSMLLVATCLIIISGCSTTRAYSDAREGVNFTQFQSFAWLPDSDSIQEDIYDNQIVRENIRSHITSELKDRGYSVNSENPDLLVLMHVNFEDKEELLRSPIYSSYGYYYPGFYAGPGYPYYYNYYGSVPYVSGYDIRTVEFTEGTIVVDIIKADTKELIWRGWSETRIDDPDHFRKDINASVDEIFDEYPLGEKRG
jgi:hypothetical protein